MKCNLWNKDLRVEKISTNVHLDSHNRAIVDLSSSIISVIITFLIIMETQVFKLYVCIAFIKLMLYKSYKSTDYDVH